VSNGSFAPSFSSDDVVVIAGWPLSATDRTSSPYVSDIASIVHKTEVGIYGLALSHTDWVADSAATTPNANGEFEVTEAGGSLTLTLPNNYVERLQRHVPAQTAPEGIPQAYITRQHDYYYAAENYPETTREAILGLSLPTA